MRKQLRIALLHAAIVYGQVEDNRRALLDMIGQAAGEGADLIMAPEMALSGYSFTRQVWSTVA
jgi:predicted amidohydrolase